MKIVESYTEINGDGQKLTVTIYDNGIIMKRPVTGESIYAKFKRRTNENAFN